MSTWFEGITPAVRQSRWWRSLRCRTALMATALTGCSDGRITELELAPPIRLLDGKVAEPRLVAQLESSVFPNEGGMTRTFAMRVTNNLSEPVSGGACAVTDVRPLTSGTWVNATPAELACPGILLGFASGGVNTVAATADAAVLRQVASQSGGRAILRARHVVSSESASYVVQSAEREVVVP